MDYGNLVILLVFIFMEDECFLTQGYKARTPGSAPSCLRPWAGHLPSLGLFLHLEKVPDSADILLYKKQGPLVSFLCLSVGEEKLKVSCLQ